MRKFYIFNINDEFTILNSDNGFDLYKQMESIHNLDKDNFYNAIKLYETIAHTIDKNDLNKEIYKNIKIITFILSIKILTW